MDGTSLLQAYPIPQVPLYCNAKETQRRAVPCIPLCFNRKETPRLKNVSATVYVEMGNWQGYILLGVIGERLL